MDNPSDLAGGESGAEPVPPVRRTPVAIEVPAEAEGERLDIFLARGAGLESRSRIKALAKAGGVLVDGKPAKPGQSVTAGQRILVLPLELPDDPAPAPVALLPEVAPRILFEDALLLVVDKPAGLSSHRPEGARPSGGNLADVLESLRPGLSRAGGEDRPGIVHRLDRETSGVMVVARTDAALLALKAQFKARTVEKEYRAIVFGVPRFDSDWIERAIAPHPDRGDRMVVVKEGGREASTYYEVVERFVGFSHVRCKPKTGRTHQIRVHLTSIGHSLVGDHVYRSRNHQQVALPPEAPDPARHCLHAIRLEFDHPHTHERMAFESPMPSDMERLLAWLRVHRAAVDG
ncbi:MAG: RluA family pseudouridine synthase [Planctomycetota bacterium]